MIKVAILIMYCRVFPLKNFKIAAWILSVITVVYSLMFTFLCKYSRQCNISLADKDSQASSSAHQYRELGITISPENVLTFKL